MIELSSIKLYEIYTATIFTKEIKSTVYDIDCKVEFSNLFRLNIIF